MILTTPSNTLNTFTSSGAIQWRTSICHDLFVWDDASNAEEVRALLFNQAAGESPGLPEAASS